MSSRLQEIINSDATKLIKRHQAYATNLAEELRRKSARSGLATGPKTIHVPPYWAADPGFNPYHVRKNAERIAHSIDRALRSRMYQPFPAVRYTLPKSGGGQRVVSVFQVADNALSRLVYKSLLQKNASRLSSRCFAYRTDLTVHDAVLHMSSSFRSKRRVFIAEFDFTKYFDSLTHEHINRILRDKRFYITPREKLIVDAFLRSDTHEHCHYSRIHATQRSLGIPQGTSISLFLANAAATPLDYALEGMSVDFARYADDTVIWSDDYTALCRAVDALDRTASEMGVALNPRKSEGVRLLVEPEAKAEIESTNRVEFLGYSLSQNRISIKQSALTRFKKHVSYLVYSNLLMYPKKGVTPASRLTPPADRDYISMIHQVRRYLYGDLSESRLNRYLTREVPNIRYRGLLSFYPIVDDDQLLKQLDGWLLHTIYTSLRVRKKLFSSSCVGPFPPPHGLNRKALLDLRLTTGTGETLDLRIPSFLKISRLLRKAADTHGPSAIAHPKSVFYYV